VPGANERVGEGAVIVVAGYIQVKPEDREAFLSSRQEAIARSRREEGCLEYAFSADSTDPGRVRVFEIWESDRELDLHLDRRSAPRAPDSPVSTLSRELWRYEVDSLGPLRS